MPNHHALINEIFQEIIFTERRKKDISQEILFEKETNGINQLIYSFLSYELDKHEMFEAIARIAFVYSERSIVELLEKYYQFSQGVTLLERIHIEITTSALLMDLTRKKMNGQMPLTFVERRCLKEIYKYIIAQARYYLVYK